MSLDLQSVRLPDDGGVLVVTVDAILSPEMAERVRAHMQSVVLKSNRPDCPVLILDRSVSIETLSREQLQRLGLALLPANAGDP